MSAKNAITEIAAVSAIAGMLADIDANIAEAELTAPEVSEPAVVETVQATVSAEATKTRPAKKNKAKQAAAVVVEAKPIEIENIKGDWTSLFQKVTADEITKFADDLTMAFAERIVFERSKPAGGDGIVAKLESALKRLQREGNVKALIVAKVKPSFVNESHNKGSRYNVYAVDKLVDLTSALAGGTIGNKINAAIVQSLAACEKHNIPFGGETALAAVSNKIRIAGELNDILFRHNVDQSTASTQKSSTLKALQTLGAVKNVSTGRAGVYRLNQTPASRRLLEAAA